MNPITATARNPPRLARRMGHLGLALALMAVGSTPALASIAYGSLNNFDCFNDTGVPAHGFEIEVDGVSSTSITYTYDYNHYGVPVITTDLSDPAHPKTHVRYAASYDATTKTFSAYTAVPASPPAPTQGHQCTNPSVNYGCEHFGVGYYGTAPVRYNWLIEDPANPGRLILGPPVTITTPSFTYSPVAPAQPVAQVQAVIPAPPPPPAPVYEFGEATWVKEIKTATHNANPVPLNELVDPDPANANAPNWTNGEPSEVEVEWQILQTDTGNPNAVNNDLAGAPEDLPNGDETITRRWEFYKYTGPLDPQTHEALCDVYPQIADPANPAYLPECDPATVNVLGAYIGAQMSGFDVKALLGLIDHLQDGTLGNAYTPRSVVVNGNTPYLASLTAGSLPPGLSLDPVTGILSGTPTAAGQFAFTLAASDANAGQVSKAYTLTVIDPNAGNQKFTLSVNKSGNGTGSVTGGGINCGANCSVTVDSGTAVPLSATPDANSVFGGWGGACAGTGACSPVVTANTTVNAVFGLKQFPLTVTKSGNGSGTVAGGNINCGATCSGNIDYGTVMTLTATPATGSVFTGWGGGCAGTGSCSITMSAAKTVTATFTLQQFPLSVNKTGTGNGTVAGGPINCGTTCSASLDYGTVVSLVATPAGGSVFSAWSGACSGSAACSVTMTQAQTVSAKFVPLTYPLQVTVNGSVGAGVVVSTPAGINCGPICQADYLPGTVVKLTVRRQEGYQFIGWSGACSGKGPCQVTMSAARSVTASFHKDRDDAGKGQRR